MSKIGAPERTVQNGVIKFFADAGGMAYRYIGNLKDQINKNTRTDDMMAFLHRKGYEDNVARRAVEEFTKIASDLSGGLYEANKRVYSLLRYGVKVKPAAGETPITVRMIDWDDPMTNDFAIAEEVTVLENAEKRPDLVIYVNGIALAVIELKKSTVSVAEAIRQNLTNQKTNFIEGFFSTVQLTIAGNPSEGVRYGTIYTPEKYYLEWKNDGCSEDEATLALVKKAQSINDELHKGLFSLLEKKRLLELVHDFIVFDAGVKKVCRYNQYYGVKAAQERLKSGRGGIIWHTQGSGKTLTMVWLANWIRSSLEDARVLLITDREELDEQLEKTFKNADESSIIRTKNSRELVDRLNRYDGGQLICSLIHKFGAHSEGATEKEVKEYIDEMNRSLPIDFSAKGNFYVFVDECHRTQSGKLHEAMKKLLGDAVFIGFTGTPFLRKNKRSSLEIFGGYIHTYKYDKAVDDKVVLDLRYEARDVEQRISSPDKIDEWFEAKTAGLNARAKAKLKKMWGNMQSVFSSKDRLKKIALDIKTDMDLKPRLASDLGNAMLVANDIYSAIRYWKIFTDELNFKKCAVVTSYRPSKGDLRTETSDIYEESAAEEKYKLFCEMFGAEDPEEYEKEAKQKFIDEPANMKLLIVVDKLLTGFDAPPCTYLYIDKKMQDITLFQAVCRVNRLDGEDKDFGYIVDYKQLFGALTDAVSKFTSLGAEGAFEGFDDEDISGLLKDRLAAGKKYLDETLDELDDLCDGVPMPREEKDFRRYFCGEDGQSEEEQEIHLKSREKLYRLVTRLIRAYGEIKGEMVEAGYTPDQCTSIGNKVVEYTNLRGVIGRASADFIDMKVYESDMRFLIDNYIMADDSKKIGSFDDYSLLDFISNKQDEDEPNTPGGHEAVAETIENNTRKKIVEKLTINPKYYERMSAILDKLIQERRAGTLQYKEMLAQYAELVTQLTKPEEDEAYPASVRHSEALRALYDNTGGNPELAIALDRAVRSSKESQFRGNTGKENKIKGSIYNIVKDKDEVERIFKIVCAQEEY